MAYEQYEREIAKATDVFLGIEPDHGFFVLTVQMDYGSASQGFQAVLGPGTIWHVLHGVLKAFGVGNIADIKGRTVFVLKEGGYNGFIRGFEPLPTEKGEAWTTDEIEIRSV